MNRPSARLLIILLSIIYSCNNAGSDKSATDSPSTPPLAPSDTTAVINSSAVDSQLLTTYTKRIMTALSNKQYAEFANFFHPAEAVRFTPYGYIDTTKDLKFTKEQFIQQLGKRQKLIWGSFDGSGDPIRLTIEEYFNKFVYDVKFIEPEKLNINKTSGSGNSIDNLLQIYPDAVYTESYFSGFDKQYGGMDWRSLKLVFKKSAGQLFLIAVIHGQWTI